MVGRRDHDKKREKGFPRSPAMGALLKRFQVRAPGDNRPVEGLYKYEGEDFPKKSK